MPFCGKYKSYTEEQRGVMKLAVINFIRATAMEITLEDNKRNNQVLGYVKLKVDT